MYFESVTICIYTSIEMFTKTTTQTFRKEVILTLPTQTLLEN